MKKNYISTDASAGVGVFASFGEAVSQFFFSALFLPSFYLAESNEHLKRVIER